MSNEITEALAELKANYADKLSALQNQVLKLEQKAADRGEPGSHRGDKPGMSSGVNIASKIKATAGWTAFKNGAPSTGKIDLQGLSFKDALVSDAGQGQGSPAAGGYHVQPTHQPGLFGYSQRELTLMRALPSRPVGSNTFTFNRLSGFTAAAAAQAGEAAAKAEQEIDTTLIESPISTIAVHAGVSTQAASDDAILLGSVSSLLQSTLAVKAESVLVTGSGTNGEPLGLALQSSLFAGTADRLVDKIGECSATMVNNGYAPGLVLLNPLDWFEIQRERASDGHYLTGNPAAPMAASLWGLSVVSTPAVVAGGAYVIDPRWVHILDRMSIAVVMGHANDDFTKNIIRVLVEVRIGLAVYDTAGVARLTVGSP